jgi:hypothetical protein
MIPEPSRMFRAIAVLVFLVSLLVVLMTGRLVSAVLALYPASHLASFGPAVPALSKSHAMWLPAVFYLPKVANAG